MKILIFQTEAEAKRRAAALLLRQVQNEPESVLGLATGGTMEAIYAYLASACAKQAVSWSKIVTFNLDEYWGIPSDSLASYRTYMNTHLFQHVDIPFDATHVPASDGGDPAVVAQSYEAAIAAAGGIDLQLLGIGKNGHIGFNEPTSSLNSATRIKTLTQETRDANRRFFDRLEDVPKYALTVGIGTILASRNCIIVGTGIGKAAAVKAMIEGPVTAACPASALQMHRNVTVIVDRDAAKDLELTGYYQLVHPEGGKVELGDV